MSVTLSGIGVSRGIVIGHIRRVFEDAPEVLAETVAADQVQAETARYQQALERARAELRAVKNDIPQHTPAEIAAFIDTHLLMLQDSALSQAVVSQIREQHLTAEWALEKQRRALTEVFEEMEDPYLRTRRDDVDHVVNRVHRLLARHDTPASDRAGGQGDPVIALAGDMSPAELINLQHDGVSGFITESGGPLSHTAILARGLGIPGVVGAREARGVLHDRQAAVLDGERGTVVADPDARELTAYRRRQREQARHQRSLTKLRDRPARTRDGRNITLRANIELPEDLEAVRTYGAEGVGLYRTESLYLNRDEPPDETEQLEAYRQVMQAIDGPLTVRTVDVGADKPHAGRGRAPSLTSNPALGLRAVRLCLKDTEFFRPQLRALLRASAEGEVQIMVPMLSSHGELRAVREMLAETQEQLRGEGLPFDGDIKLGAMIEVPAAALSAGLMASHADFLSIGTNDLIQYTLAIDRIDDEVNYLYDPLHPAVLRLIAMTISAGRAAGVPVAMCGEMAGDPGYTRILLGLGLTEFSMQPSALLEVKHLINDSDTRELGELCNRLLSCDDPEERASLLARIQDGGGH